ncbi:MAG: deoxyribodipyrimidine photo-lyase [Thermodesulfobacteriota bacterium]
MHPDRIRHLKQGLQGRGPVVYWMSRDQRLQDNWGLLYAQEKALEKRVPLAVVFVLAPHFIGATLRQCAFMSKGLQEVEKALRQHQIPFFCLVGDPGRELPVWLKKTGASCLITDFDPLKIKRRWKEAVAEAVEIPFLEVDAHNIIPCWRVSPKQEFGAYTLRPKIFRLLDEFLETIPPLKKHPFPWKEAVPLIDWTSRLQGLPIDRSVPEVFWIIPGEKAARKTLHDFLEKGLASYANTGNDPNQAGQSNLSPYLHFGQLSAQRVVLEVRKSANPSESVKAFLEQLIVRRELSDNFCFYNQDYDNFSAFPAWGQRTLEEHKSDVRPYLYTLAQLESAGTHDPLWNAAQREMVERGKMHGYLRMYWAKKILEWTNSPQEAQQIAITLNDRFELDGRDPNGYCGIAWSIGGLHDRAWGARPIFGKVRYMSYQGARSKFDVDRYVSKNLSLNF